MPFKIIGYYISITITSIRIMEKINLINIALIINRRIFRHKYQPNIGGINRFIYNTYITIYHVLI